MSRRSLPFRFRLSPERDDLYDIAKADDSRFRNVFLFVRCASIFRCAGAVHDLGFVGRTAGRRVMDGQKRAEAVKLKANEAWKIKVFMREPLERWPRIVPGSSRRCPADRPGTVCRPDGRIWRSACARRPIVASIAAIAGFMRKCANRCAPRFVISWWIQIEARGEKA